MAPVQRAPRRAVVMPPGTMPGAARVQAYEACPQGPPLAPSAERLRKTPLSERGGRIVLIFLLKSIKSQGFNSHKFVNCTRIETTVARYLRLSGLYRLPSSGGGRGTKVGRISVA